MPRLTKTVVAVALTAFAAAAPSADARWQHFAAPSGATGAPPSTGQLLRQAKQAFAPGGRAADLTPVLKQLATRLPDLHGS